MAVTYAFPSSLYKSEYSPANLDEIEIIDPLGGDLAKSTGAMNTARMRLAVNSFVLHHIVVTITLTRLQTGLPAAILPHAVPPANAAATPPNMVASNGGVFEYFNSDAETPPWEAKWKRDQLAVNQECTFEATFNVGTAPGSYQITYRVMSDELQTAMTRVETLVVS